MKKISDTYYDETGLCPVCGEGLVPVMIYSGKVLNTHVSTKVQDINTKVRTTTTTYTNIKPLYVGYCLECAKQAHEAKQEQKDAEMRNGLAVGDEVTTIGGITGTICAVKDETIVIETGADRVRIEFAKFALSENHTASARAAEESKKAKEQAAKEKAAKKA